MAVPVDQPEAAVDQAVPKQAEEGLTNSPCAHSVHGEAGPLPVAGAAHLMELLDDALLILVLPGPDPLHQSLPPYVVAGLAFQLEKAFLHHRLSGDPGMVGPGHPQAVQPLHAVPASEEVLHGVVHSVSHVQGAGDIGQRHHDDICFRAFVGDGGKGVRLDPASVDVVLVLFELVMLRYLFGHWYS